MHCIHESMRACNHYQVLKANPIWQTQVMAPALEAPASTGAATAPAAQGPTMGPARSPTTNHPSPVGAGDEIRSRAGAMLAGIQAGAQAVFGST